MKLIFLEEDFIDSFLDAGKVEIRFRKNEIRLGKIQVETFFAEYPIPHLRFDVPIDEVTFLKRELIEKTAHVLARERESDKCEI